MAGKGQKRKTVSRGSTSQTRNSAFNANMFSSWGCQQFHESIQGKTKWVKEKALLLAQGDFEEMRVNISNRGWENYVSYPHEASKALVYEFFANVFPKPIDGPLVFPESSSFVRDCSVPFDSATINELFGIEPVPAANCQFRTKIRRTNLREDLDHTSEIRALLCKPGFGWVHNAHGEPQKIMTSSLTPVAKGWADFILHTICPSSNQSELSVERATLATCIIKGEPVNLGWVLEQELNKFAKFRKGTKEGVLPSYWKYASLVSLLCRRAGVVTNERDAATVSPAIAITGKWIRIAAGLEHPAHSEEHHQEEPDDLGPTFTMEDIPLGPTMADFQQLQARMDALTTNQQQITATLQQITTNQQHIQRQQHSIIVDQRAGMRYLYRAMVASQRGDQLDPAGDVFPPPPLPPRQ